MRKIKKYYLKILQIELEDLKDDIQLMIENCGKDHNSGKITERVHRENVTLFNNELLGIDEFSNIISHTDPELFEDLDALISHLRKVFNEKRRINEIANAINICIERKLEKVAEYVTQKSD